MAVPTHHASCTTRAWPATCPDCTARVFYFSCSCGSKVFFDALGHPWPQHQDRCLAHGVRLLRDADGLSLDQVTSRIEERARASGQAVPKHVRVLLRALQYRETGHPTRIELLPENDAREFDCVLQT